MSSTPDPAVPRKADEQTPFITVQSVLEVEPSDVRRRHNPSFHVYMGKCKDFAVKLAANIPTKQEDMISSVGTRVTCSGLYSLPFYAEGGLEEVDCRLYFAIPRTRGKSAISDGWFDPKVFKSVKVRFTDDPKPVTDPIDRDKDRLKKIGDAISSEVQGQIEGDQESEALYRAELQKSLEKLKTTHCKFLANLKNSFSKSAEERKHKYEKEEKTALLNHNLALSEATRKYDNVLKGTLQEYLNALSLKDVVADIIDVPKSRRSIDSRASQREV